MKFSGHTEYIGLKCGSEPIMMLHTERLKIALLTTHVPLSEVPKLITKERLESYIEIISKELTSFGLNFSEKSSDKSFFKYLIRVNTFVAKINFSCLVRF